MRPICSLPFLQSPARLLRRAKLLPLVGAVALAGAALACAQGPLPPASAFAAIVHQPATETAFTLDRSMLAAAEGLLNGQDAEGHRIAAGLNSVTVHNYHYRDGADYDPGAFAALDQQFRASGYQHLVNANAHGGPSTTDLWLRFQGANVNSVVVLTRGDRNMSAVVVDCTLRPLDLLHLGGHFGIPQISPGAVMIPPQPPAGAVMVPANPQGYAVPDPQPYPAPQPQAQSKPMQNPPTLKHHTLDDPQ